MKVAQKRKNRQKCKAKMFLALSGVWLLMWGLWGCTTDSDYLHYQSLRVSGWEYRDSLVFTVDSLPAAGTRHLSLALRKSAAQAYPYTSLTVAMHQVWTLGDSTLTQRTDSFECVFENPDGTLRTKGISLFPYEFSLMSLSLPQHATGRIVIRHLMNQQSLPGFDAIGVRVE